MDLCSLNSTLLDMIGGENSLGGVLISPNGPRTIVVPEPLRSRWRPGQSETYQTERYT